MARRDPHKHCIDSLEKHDTSPAIASDIDDVADRDDFKIRTARVYLLANGRMPSLAAKSLQK